MKKRLKQEEEHIAGLNDNQIDISKKKKSNKLNAARQKFKEEQKAKEEKRKVQALFIKFCAIYCFSNLIKLSTALPYSFVCSFLINLISCFNATLCLSRKLKKQDINIMRQYRKTLKREKKSAKHSAKGLRKDNQ